MQAYIHEEEGKRWVRVIEDNHEWDEDAKGWTIFIDLRCGKSYLISPTGEAYPELLTRPSVDG